MDDYFLTFIYPNLNQLIMFIDAHSHLSSYGENIPSVIAMARSVGVKHIIAVGSTYNSSEGALKCSREYPDFVHPAVGISYRFAKRDEPLEKLLGDVKKIDALVKNEKRIIAIGEIGIDTGITLQRRYGDQVRIFREQLEIAQKYRKGVIVHSFSDPNLINTEREALKILAEYDVKPVVMHFFQAREEEDVKAAVDAGYYFSVAPQDVYGNLNDKSEAVVSQIDPSKLIIETDGPRGENIWPDVLPLVAKTVAKIKKKDAEEMEKILYDNAQKIYFDNL